MVTKKYFLHIAETIMRTYIAKEEYTEERMEEIRRISTEKFLEWLTKQGLNARERVSAAMMVAAAALHATRRTMERKEERDG